MSFKYHCPPEPILRGGYVDTAVDLELTPNHILILMQSWERSDTSAAKLAKRWRTQGEKRMNTSKNKRPYLLRAYRRPRRRTIRRDGERLSGCHSTATTKVTWRTRPEWSVSYMNVRIMPLQTNEMECQLFRVTMSSWQPTVDVQNSLYFIKVSSNTVYEAAWSMIAAYTLLDITVKVHRFPQISESELCFRSWRESKIL